MNVDTSKHFRGECCVKCGETLRYIRDGKCVTCRHRSAKALYDKKTPEGTYRKPWDGNEVSENMFLGKPCRVCGETLRYKAGAKSCVACHKRRTAERRADPVKAAVDAAAIKRWQDEDYRKNPEKYRTKRKLATLGKYGLTQVCYDTLLKFQGGGCAICGAKKADKARRLAVDHCHETGAVRGLLCACCNTAIGKLRDDPDLMIKAAEYVRARKPHKEKQDAA
jgi:hypothetical protein